MGALFPVPKEEGKRVMTWGNEEDFISFRHHVFVKNTHKDVQLAEVGPRFEAKRQYFPSCVLAVGNYAAADCSGLVGYSI